MRKLLKPLFWLFCIGIMGSNLWTMRSWTERTGVYDDLCYLRQAHLFQRFGLGGFDTNINRDDDRYFATMTREIGYEAWDNPALAPCHPEIGEKRVLQYPPGTGLALAIFPEGLQRVPLYVAANLFILLAAAFAIYCARLPHEIAGSGVIGMAAIYFMINPSKASYSMAPTMVVCAAVGFLTAIIANAPKTSRRNWATAAAGILLGLAVSFRIPNLLLSAGYFLVLMTLAVCSRKLGDVLRLALFGVAYLLGLAPTLAANLINAGSIFRTTYGSVDATPPDLSFSVAGQYFSDMQGALILFVTMWTIVALVANIKKTASSIVAINIVVSLGFFLTHSISTSYYLMPLLMLCMWTLLFSYFNDADFDESQGKILSIPSMHGRA